MDDDAGALIVKETKPGHDNDHHPPSSLAHETNPSLAALGNNFDGPSKVSTSTITKIVGILNSGQSTKNGHHQQEDEQVFHYTHKDQPLLPSSHQPLGSNYQSNPHEHRENHEEHKNNYDYQNGDEVYDSYGTKLKSSSSQLSGSRQQSNHDHQSLAYQQIQAILNTHLEVPKLQEPTVFKHPSTYATYNYYENQQQSEPLKIPILNNDQNSLDNIHDYYQGDSYNHQSLPNYGNDANTIDSMIGLHTDGSQLSMIPDYNNYQLPNNMGYNQHVHHHGALGGPDILGVWARMSRQTGRGGKKVMNSNKRQKIQRAVAYMSTDLKLTRI